MTTTRLILTAAGLAATATLALPVVLPVASASATQSAPECAATGRALDIDEIVALRKQAAAQYLVDHAAELAHR